MINHNSQTSSPIAVSAGYVVATRNITLVLDFSGSVVPISGYLTGPNDTLVRYIDQNGDCHFVTVTSGGATSFNFTIPADATGIITIRVSYSRV